MTAGAALVAACSSTKPGKSPRTAPSPSSTSSARPRFRHRPNASSAPASPGRTTCWPSESSPIAVTDWFGGEPFGVWPWAQPKLGGAQPVVLNLDDGIQVDQIAVAQARPHRRHQRRTGPRHLHQAVGHRADDRAVRAGRVLRAVEGPGHRDRSGRVQGRRHGQPDHRRRRQVHRRRQEQPAIRRQEGAVARRDLLSGQRSRHHARLAHRLPHQHGLRHSGQPTAGWCHATRWRRSSTRPTC